MAHKTNGDMNPFGESIPEDEEFIADGASTPETVHTP